MAQESENQFGQYNLIEKIAQGGMAQVFKAKTTDSSGIERLVVIKRILPHIASHPEYVEMLIDEAKIAVHFTHGNIAQVYDLGRILDDYFIVMEYVDGKTLSQIFRTLKEKNKNIPLDIMLYCLIELCHGLSYIHRKKGGNGQSLGVVHRDISPQNIILSYSGNVKIIDFGVAKADFIEGKTEDGVLKGKFAYMSPEQTKGGKIDHRSDIFSTGILLWELSTGQRLFKRKTHRETVKAVQKNKFELPSKIRAGLPKSLDKVVRKALHKNPRFRYKDAMQMAEDLEKILFSVNPDFRPIDAAKFLYKTFGPEQDEQELSHSLLTSSDSVKEAKPANSEEALEVTPAQKMVLEEPTLREKKNKATTPIVKFHFKNKFTPTIKYMVLGSLVFILGTVYSLMSHWSSDKGYVIFKNRHPQMILTLDHKRLPQAAQNEIPVLANHEHSLVVERQGYQKKFFRFNLEKGQHKILNLKLTQHSDMGKLNLTTKPPGAKVRINGVLQNQLTPLQVEKLDPKKSYDIEFELENHKIVKRRIQIIAGKEITVHQPLRVEYAHIMVTSDPSEALVFVNGVEVGKTPFESKSFVPNRNLTVTLVKPQYKPKSQNIRLKAGEKDTLHFQLFPREKLESPAP